MAKKVLMPLDFSTYSQQMFKIIPELQQLGLEELLLAHVVKIKGDGAEDIRPAKKLFLEMSEKYINEARKNEIEVSTRVCLGMPSEEICRLAISEACDMIVIGSTGEGSAVRSTFLGATAANVVRSSTVPVLVEKFSHPKKLDTVLVPVDFSTCSEAVLKWVYGYSNLFRRVILVHVLDKPEDREEMAEEERRAQIKLDRWSERINKKGPETKIVIGKGIASKTILSEAQESEASLIAMSRRGRGLIAGLLIGSTADTVVRRAKTAVLMFPF